MQNIDPDDLIEAANEAENQKEKYCSRESISKDKKTASSRGRKRQKSHKPRNSGTDTDPTQNYQFPLPKQRFNSKPSKKPSEDEEVKIRIEEQKRKLSGFLKLAKQLKSQQDQQVIVELIEVIKDSKKPLPISKINELKKLELMASPYS